MILQIEKRKLTDKEIEILIEEVNKFFSPIVGYKDKWQNFDTVYIATDNNQLVGVCGVEYVKNWRMLHPFVVLEKYQGHGIGSLLMENVIKESKGKNIFIGSQNVAVTKIASKYKFKTIHNVLALPLVVKIYLLKFTLDSINFRFMRALIYKRFMPRGKFQCFIKEV